MNAEVRRMTHFEQQAYFMKACGQEIPNPGLHNWNPQMELYWNLVKEEMGTELPEFVEKYQKNPSLENLTEIADAIFDSVFVLYGLANSLGIPYDEVWDEGQGSNLAKIDPVTGMVTKREDGKILKPKGWVPPDFWSILHEHISRFTPDAELTRPRR